MKIYKYYNDTYPIALHLAYLSGWIGEQHKNLIDELKQNKKKSKK